jgi:hypothetical protein
MWLRRAFFWWLFPAAVILPVWLLAGWIAFDAGGWALLWVLFLAMPSVFFGQLVLGLLVRARSSVRATRSVSWWDVAGFGLWHALVIATGLFSPSWFALTLILAMVGAVALFWLTLWQLWREARAGAQSLLRAADGTGYLPPQHPPRAESTDASVFVITERPSGS